VLNRIKGTIQSLNLRNTALGSSKLLDSIIKNGIKLSNLTVWETISDSELQDLLKYKEAIGLAYLDLSGATLTKDRLPAIFKLPWTGLTMLRCKFIGDKPENAYKYFSKFNVTQLVALALGGKTSSSDSLLPITDECLQPLLTSNPSQLKYLHLSYTAITDKFVLPFLSIDAILGLICSVQNFRVDR